MRAPRCRARPRCRPRPTRTVEALRAVALEGVTDPVTVELTQDPSVADEGDKEAEVTYTLIVSAGSEQEEYPGVTLKKGRNNVATKVNAASKLIKIEETGVVAARARASRPASTRCRRPLRRPSR